jgi:hypothetical protein
MSEIVHFSFDEVIPTVEAILKAQGVPESVSPDVSLTRLAEHALALYQDSVWPSGICAEISVSDFENVYEGEGGNDADSPLVHIYPQAEHLTLFAVTMGESVCSEIKRLFDTNEPALGSMLDAAASQGAELASQGMVKQVREKLKARFDNIDSKGILEFSPGYCGWHVSGQRKLFQFLQPEEIGISLNDSCLMQPLKSVSGVIVYGPMEIFDFDMTFPACENCQTYSCRDRVRAVF